MYKDKSKDEMLAFQTDLPLYMGRTRRSAPQAGHTEECLHSEVRMLHKAQLTNQHPLYKGKSKDEMPAFQNAGLFLPASKRHYFPWHGVLIKDKGGTSNGYN